MLNEIILNLLNENKKEEIFFWGASDFLKEFISKNDLSMYNIKGVLDSDKELWGKKIGKYKIQDFQEKFKNSKIIFMVKNNHNRVYSAVYRGLKVQNCEKCLLQNPFYKSNKLYLIDNSGKKKEVSDIKGLNIKWMGCYSTIEIGCNPVPNFNGSTIEIYSDAHIKIGSSIHEIRKLEVEINDNSKIEIGENFSCRQTTLWITGEKNKKITIGKDCMFSREILLRTSDVHTILDKTTGEILNEGGDINIGNHVWIAQRAMVLKKSTIPNGSVIASNSLVNKKHKEKDAIYAGYPAKIIKRNIIWDRESIDKYKKMHLQ